MNVFDATIPGTNGKPGPKSQSRHPGDEPLSAEGQEYLERLWRETDASIRLDLAMYGEVRRWSWKTMMETKMHQANSGTGKFRPRSVDQPAL